MKYIYGIDETAKSPVIGSLPVCIVKVPVNFFRKKSVQSLIIKDSKLMTKNQIKRTYIALHNKVESCIVKIYPEDMEGNNLIDLEVQAIITGLKTLGYTNEPVYIDLFEHSKQNLIKRFQNFGFHANFNKWIVEHEADINYKVVSLASIFSRMANLEEYESIRKEYNIGSGCCSDKNTIRFLIENYENPQWFIRKSWKTYKRLQNKELRKRLLEDIKLGKQIRYLYDN